MVALFTTAPPPDAGALDGVPLPALVPADELEQAAAPSATAAIPATATILIRIDVSFCYGQCARCQIGRFARAAHRQILWVSSSTSAVAGPHAL